MNIIRASHHPGALALALCGVLIWILLLAGSPGEQPRPVQAAVPAAGAGAAAPGGTAAPADPNACLADAGYDSTLERTRFCVYYNTVRTTLAQATTVANQVDDYWDKYVELGFTAPLVSGGEAKLRVQIVAGACNGVAWENYIQVNQGCLNTSDAEMQHTQGHELFHRVQFNYDADWYPDWAIISWLYEGTARMMEDETFANMDNWADAMTAAFSFNEEVNNYLLSAQNDLTSHPMRYKSALWWKYFAEQFGTVMTEPQRGVDAIRKVWEAVHPASDISAINSTLATLSPGMTFDKAFRRFVVANWAKGLTGLPDKSYYYDDEREAGNPATYGPITPNNGGTINLATTATWTNQAVARYGARYYKAAIGASCPIITATFHRDSGTNAFYHIVTQRGGAFAAHREGSGSDWSQSFLNDGITQIVAIIGGQDAAAQVDISLSCANPSLQIMLPNSTAVAYAGPHNAPGKILAQVLVTNPAVAGSPVVTGLTNASFTAQVNGIDATVTGGGFIQEQYWLVLQAPTQASNGSYGLTVSLQAGGSTLGSATNPNSVMYSTDLNDQVLIVDRSGSMSEGDKMPSAREAADLYVDITQDQDGLAVIGFDHKLNPVTPFALQPVNAGVRTAAHTFITGLTPAGMTSIGAGLQEAINQRKASPTANARCSFILLSDGMENSAPLYADVKADLHDLGCPVTTIALGQASDETLLQQIATDNGGLFFYNDVFVSAALGPAAVDSVADTHLDLANTYEYAQAFNEKRSRLLSVKGSVSVKNGPVTHKFLVDDSVNEIVFTLDWLPTSYAKLELTLVNPDGNTVPPASWDVEFANNASDHYGGRLSKLMPGTWSLIVTNLGSEISVVPYQVIVSGLTHLTVELMLPDRLGRSFTTGQPVPIYALLSSKEPIPGADVKARVTAPDGMVTLLTLYDDGQHDDGAANDGLYAGLYTRVTQSAAVASTLEEKNPTPKNEGSYRVLVTADGSAGKYPFHREALGAFAVLAGTDRDQDGVPDIWERVNGATNLKGDNDLDGLSNLDEYSYGTDPNDPDTDDGGESDGSEIHRQVPKNPLDPADDVSRRPAFLRALAQVDMVRLLYDYYAGSRTPCTSVRLFRATAEGGPFTLLATETQVDGEFVDKVPNGTQVYYRMICDYADGGSSAYVESPAATPSSDPYPPEARIVINHGAPWTSIPQVHLDFVPLADLNPGEPDTFSDIQDVLLSNQPDFAGATWQTFGQGLGWTLSGLPGNLAHVYARFRDSFGNESVGVEVATIRYELRYYLAVVKR